MKNNIGNDDNIDRKEYMLSAFDYLLYLSVVVLQCGRKHGVSSQRVKTHIQSKNPPTHTHKGWRYCADSKISNMIFKIRMGNFSCQQLQVKSILNIPRNLVMLCQ